MPMGVTNNAGFQVLIFSCALGSAVGLVYVWAFARALASSLESIVQTGAV